MDGAIAPKHVARFIKTTRLDGITRPEESYRLWRVVVCDQETSNEEAKARYGAVKNTTRRVVTPRKQTRLYGVRCGAVG